MASGLFGLLDDVAALAKAAAASIDDVGLAASKASMKAAGVVVDDTAVTPTYVHGLAAERELPIIKRIAKGSLKNKLLFILPAALLLSQFLPVAVEIILMAGGTFLCYEGAHKIMHKLTHRGQHVDESVKEVFGPEHEETTVKGAIRTDFILSAEIIVIALGIVGAATFAVRVAVLVGIALLMTVGVYGLVAGIVKIDDAGLYLVQREGDGVLTKLQRLSGRGLLAFAPWLMKLLSVLGTAAMFLVGGGILAHGMPWLAHGIKGVAAQVAAVNGVGSALSALTPVLASLLVGLVAGAIAMALMGLAQQARQALR